MDGGSINGATFPVAVVNAGAPQGDAHELGHGIGRNHASGDCGASDKSSPFDDWPPNGHGYLDSVGLDIRPGSGTGYGGEYRAIAARADTNIGSSDQTKANFNPYQWYDYMSYCPALRNGSPTGNQLDNWISAKGWDLEVESLRTYAQARGRAAVAARVVPGVHVVGYAVGSGPLVLWSVGPAAGVVAADDGAGFHAIVRARDGHPIASAPLRADLTHVDDPAGADVVIVDGTVPLPAVTAGGIPPAVGAVEVDRGVAPVGIRTRSLHAPTVVLAAPGRGTHLKPGSPLSVAWQAGDIDGDTLIASVDYSTDAGRSFHTVWSGPSTGAAEVPGAMLTSSDHAVVRVRISDGFDQASAVSPEFSTPGRAPDVAITSPAAGTTVAADVPIRLAGRADDDRFAWLRGRALRWTLDGRTVATGPRGTVHAAKPGSHVIGLVATDRTGRAQTETVKVQVEPATPRLLSLDAPVSVATRARSVKLIVTAATPCRLTLTGRGVRSTGFSVTRASKRVTVHFSPGTSPLRIALTFRSGRYGTRDTLVIAR